MSEFQFSEENPLLSLIKLAGSSELIEASAEDLRVLVCLLADPSLSVSGLVSATGCSQARVKAAVAYWQGSGVLEAGKPEKKAVPLRSARELSVKSEAETAAYIKEHNMASLIDECQTIMGRLFNSAEMAILVGLSEQLGLEDAYLITLLSWCVRREKKSMRYAERTAFGLFEEGIDTAVALDEYIKRHEKAASSQGQLRRLFGIGDRALSKTEENCFIRWICDFHYDMNIIGLAYDMTVDIKQKALVKYTNSILTRWHGAGCRTLEQVQQLLERERLSRTARPASSPKKPDGEKEIRGSFDTDEFFNRAIERSYGKKEIEKK